MTDTDDLAVVQAAVSITRDELAAALDEESRHLGATPGASPETAQLSLQETYVRVSEAINNHKAALDRLLETRRRQVTQ